MSVPNPAFATIEMKSLGIPPAGERREPPIVAQADGILSVTDSAAPNQFLDRDISMRRFVIFVAAMSVAGTAHGQTPTPAPAATPVAQGLGGPVIPGLCLLSRQAVLANAKVAKAAATRLQVLTDEAQKEIDAERKPVDTDIQAFNAEEAKLTAEQRQSRQQALQARLQPIEVKARQRSGEIDATRAKALERISTELQPVVAQVYKQRNCGMLVDRSSVIGGNMTNDLTLAVTQGLDTKISTLAFDRETLPAAPAPAARR